MKFDGSNKFDLCYYGQVNSLRLKSSVATKWASKHLWRVTFILLACYNDVLRSFEGKAKDAEISEIIDSEKPGTSMAST